VNSDGDPYPPHIQRRVPGKEKCSDQFLVPLLRNAENGIVEIMDVQNLHGKPNTKREQKTIKSRIF